MEHRAESAVDPRRTVFFSTIARAMPVIVGVSVIAGAAGVLLSQLQATEYTAQSRIVLSDTRRFDPLGAGGNGGDATRYVANQLSVLETRPVLDAAAAELADGTDSAELARSLELVAPADTDVLEITTTAPTAEGAAARANAIALAYQEFVTAQVAEAATAAADASAADPAAVAQITVQARVYGDGVQVVEQAVPPGEPTAPRPLLNGLLLAAVAALVTAGLAVLRRGDPLADRGALVEGAGAPVLGSVPVPLARLSKRAAPPLPEARDFSMALVALGYVVQDSSGVVMCTGMRRDSDAATVALGFAAAAAEQQRRVVVVDADVSGPGLVRYAQRRPALAVGALSDPSTPEGGAVVELAPLRPAGGGGSVHLASVVAQGSSPWSADELRRGLQRLVDTFDVVILHSGPVATDPLSFALLREASAVVVVVDEKSRTADLDALGDKLELAGASADGLVLTRALPTRRRRAPGPALAPAVDAGPQHHPRPEAPSAGAAPVARPDLEAPVARR